MGSPGRRTEYLLSHTLARVKIAKVLGMKPQDLPLVFENNAKPSTIHDPRSTNNWHLSLSHTSSLVAVALAPFPVGVDVEPIGRTKHIDDVARKMFSPQEADDIVSLAGDEKKLRFTRYWTLREAFYKMAGWPLGRMKQVNFQSVMSDASKRSDMSDKFPVKCFFSLTRPLPDHMMALAVLSPERWDVVEGEVTVDELG